MPAEIIRQRGDLLESDAEFIVHQCNATSMRAKHLAWSVFKRFLYANDYARRTRLVRRDELGTVRLHGDGEQKRFVINLFAQRYPGKSRYSNDRPSMRLEWFKLALRNVLGLSDVIASEKKTIAFPLRIGCGAAGGNWDDYLAAIEAFARTLPDGWRVFILSK